MKNTYDSRNLYYILVIASLVMGLLMFVSNHLDFIIAVTDGDRVSVSTLSYIALRIISSMLIPATLLVPSMFLYGRVRLTRIWYMLWGAMYIVTSIWIVPYIISGGNIANEEIIRFQQRNAIVSSVVFWDTYHFAGVLFSMLYGGFLIYTGICFDDSRMKVRRNIIAVLVLRIVVPMLYNVLFQGKILSSFWLVNNYADMLSLIFLTVAVVSAARNDRLWVQLIWDHIGMGTAIEDDGTHE